MKEAETQAPKKGNKKTRQIKIAAVAILATILGYQVKTALGIHFHLIQPAQAVKRGGSCGR